MLNDIIKEQQEKARGVMAEYGANKMSYMMKDMDTLITSTAQAAYEAGKKEERERCLQIVKDFSPTDYRGYGMQAGGGLVRGMTLDDHKRNFAKEITKALTPNDTI